VLRSEYYSLAVDNEDGSRTNRLRHGWVRDGRSARDLYDITFASYDSAFAIDELKRIKPADKPGWPDNMGPAAGGLDPKVEIAIGTNPATEHADHGGQKPRSARSPTVCWQVDEAPLIAHVRRPMPADAPLRHGIS